jgi:flagellin-like hook-associated protein FlgL
MPLVASVSSLASSNAPGSALPLARAAVDRAVAATAGYGERPTFRADSVAATQASNAMSQRLRHLNQMGALDRAEALVTVTLAGLEAAGHTLEEMKILSLRLQDDSLSTQERDRLSQDFLALSASLDGITQTASFAGRNLINPDAATQTGDVALPSGNTITAHDLRKGQGTILSVDPPIKAPLLDDLLAAFAFEGNMNPAALGTPALKRVNNYGTLSYPDGEGSNSSVAASYYHWGFIETPGATVSASIKPSAAGNIIQHIISSDSADSVFISMNDSNQIVVKGFGKTVTGPKLQLNEWQTVTISSFQRDAQVYLDGDLIASVSYKNMMPTSRNSVLLYGGTRTHVDNLAVYSRALSGSEINTVTNAAQAGVQTWRREQPVASNWAQVTSDVSQSLENLRAVEAYYGGAARSLDRDRALQQRMSDILDAGVSRLVNRDIERSSILLAAAEVRVQLAQAMMDTQRSIMSEATTLFANAADVFDRINASGFRPSGLKL